MKGGPGGGRAAGVDNTARRTWDRDEFEEKAAAREAAADGEGEETRAEMRKRKRMERDPLHQGLIVARSELKARDYEVNLTERLNKTQVCDPPPLLPFLRGDACCVGEFEHG
jgi:U4/U6.U5 tri-snRNP component SNU23